MGIGERLRHRRQEMKFTRNQLAQMVRVTPSAIANYENGVSYPKPEIVILLMTALEMDANYLYQDYLPERYMDENYRIPVSEAEKDACEKYLRLTDEGKQFIRRMIHEEYARIQSENWISMPLWKPGKRQSNSGFFMREEKYVIRLPKKNLPEDTDVCFQVQVNRYEPVFKKNDVIGLKKCQAKHNEMGIFFLNGIYYIRTLIWGKNSCRLRALNVMDPEIVVTEKDEFHCLGKIVGRVHGDFEIKDNRHRL